MELVFDSVNLWEKEKNAGYQHFLLFLQCFQSAFCNKVIKTQDCKVKG